MDSEQPLVSVIIPTHNRPKMLVRAVESVLAQTYDNVEIVIVDDHSGSETKTVAERLAAYQNVCYFLSDGQGACAARNFGVKQANGVFVTGLDDDDLFTSHRIEKLVAAYEDRFSLVAARSTVFTESFCPVIDEESGRTRIFPLRRLLDNNRIGNQALIERSRFLAVGGFDTNFRARQDYDLWVRLVECYGPAKVITNKLYLRNESSLHQRISKSSKRKRGVLQFYRKHNEKMTCIQRYKYFQLMKKTGVL